MDEMLKMDGYDDCVVGTVEQFGRPTIICYDKSKVIKKLMKDGMTEEEAEEFWSYNQVGAWMGNGTPCFLTKDKDAAMRQGEGKDGCQQNDKISDRRNSCR